MKKGWQTVCLPIATFIEPAWWKLWRQRLAGGSPADASQVPSPDAHASVTKDLSPLRRSGKRWQRHSMPAGNQRRPHSRVNVWKVLYFHKSKLFICFPGLYIFESLNFYRLNPKCQKNIFQSQIRRNFKKLNGRFLDTSSWNQRMIFETYRSQRIDFWTRNQECLG